MKNLKKILSCISHDQSDYYQKSLDEWKSHNDACINNAFDNEECKIGRLLAKYPNIRSYAFDIGAGAGWLTSKLSENFEYVIAIEPSAKAIEICKTMYPQQNIIWMCGFAEDILPKIEFDQTNPIFINTCSVFIHMSDEYVTPILDIINSSRVCKGSILSFQEFWSPLLHYNEPMGNCRSIQWWTNKLCNWKLNFHGIEVFNQGSNIFKGLHGEKIQ